MNYARLQFNWTVVVWFTFFYSPISAASPRMKEQRLCDKLSLQGEERLSFSDTETRLLCGDPENEAWSNIPESQTLFHLRTFLQDRGYYQTSVVTSGPPLLVALGKKSHVRKMEWSGVPYELDVTRIRGLEGNVLTPKFLDDTKDRISQILRAKGYPCAQIVMSGDPVAESVKVEVLPSVFSHFGLVEPDAVPGLDNEVLRRYDAFRFDDPYNDQNLILAARRTTTAGLFQSTHFTPNCTGTSDRVAVHQSILAGPPRNVTIGFGVNTEQYARLKASWQKTRIGTLGSSVEVDADLAINQQIVGTSLNWYYLPFASRHFLNPQLQMTHVDIPSKEFTNIDFKTQPTLTWDNEGYGFTGALGPALHWEHNYRPLPQGDYRYAYLAALFRVTSHDYEFFQTSPRTGSDLSFQAALMRSGILADVSAQMLQVNFEHLWNLAHLDPPFLILGLRGGLATTFVNNGHVTDLPVSLRQYLGGSNDLRGFGPTPDILTGRTGNGALSSAFLSFEARTFDLLPWGLQPFVFTDFGALGEKSLSLDMPIYSSPGVGLRWESPIGSLRATIARGYLIGDTNGFAQAPPARWNFYFSFGEEF